MTLLPALAFARSAEERVSRELSWTRPDEAFFAAGACHQLAYVMASRSPGAAIVHLRPRERGGDHMVVQLDDRAFDFNGWNDVAAVIDVNAAAARERYGADWSFDRIVVPGDLAGFESYCRSHEHRLAADFAGDVVARAEMYIAGRSLP
ncbi:MAG: hypothetical protein DHS20C19_17690 [Acidimicrobiales bacterium]|nr:MAG: hypothetical protein DHS20C19_17690 [Acidimicrobiales bacterium]